MYKFYIRQCVLAAATGTGEGSGGTGGGGGAGGAGAGGAGGTGTGTGAGGTGTGDGGTGQGTGAGAGGEGGTGTGGDSDKPPAWFTAGLTSFKKELTTQFNRDINGVRGSLEKQIKAVSSGVRATSADTSMTEEELLAEHGGEGGGTGTGAGGGTGTGTGGTGGTGTGTPANQNTNTAMGRLEAARMKRMQQELDTIKQEREGEKAERAREREENQKLKIASKITDTVSKKTWASPRIQQMFLEGAINKAVLDESGDVVVDGVPVGVYVEEGWLSDRSLQPPPPNASGSGNNGGGSGKSAIDWTKFNPNAKDVTPAQREGYRTWSASLVGKVR